MRQLKYRKRPVIIEAWHWIGGKDCFNELQNWGAPVTFLPATNFESLIVGTLEDGPNSEAIHIASLGDWIIKGIQGEFYAVKPDIFEATYEAI